MVFSWAARITATLTASAGQPAQTRRGDILLMLAAVHREDRYRVGVGERLHSADEVLVIREVIRAPSVSQADSLLFH